MLNAHKEWEFGGFILSYTQDQPVRTHEHEREPSPTIVLFINPHASITQRMADEAARHLVGASVVVTEKQLHISTRQKVNNEADGIELAEEFVYQLKRVIEARKAVAGRNTSSRRNRAYLNHPSVRLRRS